MTITLILAMTIIFVIFSQTKEAKKVRHKLDFSDGIVPQLHRCHVCKKSNVRLYREYGEFLREHRIYCAKHIGKWNWKVPLIEDTWGNVWGYSSYPNNDIDKWLQLPNTAYAPTHKWI